MPVVAPWYDARDVQLRPGRRRRFHDHSACLVGTAIPPEQQRRGTRPDAAIDPNPYGQCNHCRMHAKVEQDYGAPKAAR